MMANIVIVGSSGHAKVVIDVVEKAGTHRVVGLLDRFRKQGDRAFGYEVIGSEDDLAALVRPRALEGYFVAIGDNHIRGEVDRRIRERAPSLAAITAVHPSAVIGREAEIGPGTVIMAGGIVNPASVLGRCCIVNTNSSLDHDSTMGDYSSLAPGAVTGGNCRIGTYAAVGIGATLSHGVVVGDHTLIGAGSTVLEDIGDHLVAYGTPAKPVRSRVAGEKYL